MGVFMRLEVTFVLVTTLCTTAPATVGILTPDIFHCVIDFPENVQPR